MERDPGLSRFEAALEDLSRKGRLRAVPEVEGLPGLRVVRNGIPCLNLASNNYLGLAGHPVLKQASADAALKYGTGSGGSRLLGGGLPIHAELELAIASRQGLGGRRAPGKALLFNTGFMANLGALDALAPLVGPVFSDRLNHASVAEALRMMPGKFYRYRHGDVTHLSSLLEAHLPVTGSAGAAASGHGLVVSETLFSMDGDIAPLDALLALQRKHGFFLYLDEAHSAGCRPDLLDKALVGAPPDRLISMGTFGKAYGGFGAWVAGPEPVIDWLINAARPFIFSTAIPPSAAAAALAALGLAEVEAWRREKLAETAGLAREDFRRRGLDIGASESHIVPVIAGSDAAAMAWSYSLLQDGFHAPPIRPPTVPEGTARLRINLTAEMNTDDLAGLGAALERARDAAGAAIGITPKEAEGV